MYNIWSYLKELISSIFHSGELTLQNLKNIFLISKFLSEVQEPVFNLFFTFFLFLIINTISFHRPRSLLTHYQLLQLQISSHSLCTLLLLKYPVTSFIYLYPTQFSSSSSISPLKYFLKPLIIYLQLQFSFSRIYCDFMIRFYLLITERVPFVGLL